MKASKQLKDNRCRDIRHDAKAKDRGLCEVTCSENTYSCNESSQTGTVTCLLSNCLLVHDRNRDPVTYPVNCQADQCDHDPVPEFRDREDDSDFFPHW